jgi:AcrR family transcriptional regulator
LPTHASAPDAHRTSWAGIPAEDRRAARRARLLDTAFDLLGTEGWSATTVRGVCQAAQLNPRYFYEGFDDLDALFIAVYDRTVEQLTAAMAAAVEDAGPDPVVQTRAAIEATVRFVDEDRRRGRVLYVEALGNEALNRRRQEAGFALIDVIDRDARRHGNLAAGEAIGRIGAAILVGGFSELLASWLSGRIDVTRDQLVDDATALFLALAEAAATIATTRSTADPTRGSAVGGRRRRE